MKWLLTVLAAVATVGGIFAAPRRAPANPRFADWQRRHQAGEAPGGLIPSPVDRSYLTKACRDFEDLKNASRNRRLLKSADAELPARWDSRDRDWVTSVKNQGAWGACWAFATMACLETADLKATGGSVTNDFSENHLAAHTVGFDREVDFDVGGNDCMALALLTAWRDPLNEADDPYPHVDSRVSLPAVRHVQSARFIPGRADAKDNDLLKRAVMEYGAVSVSYYDRGFYRNQQTGAYCYSGSNVADHAVTLIGWDDAYSTNNFAVGHRPPENGAFLIKNSWGAGAGTNGCLWISYSDSVFAKDMSMAYPQPEATNNYGRVYQYDPCGWVWECASGGNEDWCANVFTADATGVVSAVGFYAVAPGVSYTIRICTGCKDDPSSGTVVSEQSGTLEQPGYYTIPLQTEVPLRRAGERFAVVLKLSTELYDMPLAIECSCEGYCTATAHAGESYRSADGRNWMDLQEYDETANFCVKAYTKYGSDGPPHVPTTVFVDAGSTADEPDGSCERPFRDIASALEVVLNGDRILVAPGRYFGCVEAPAANVRIISSDGPEVTFIDGEGDDCCYCDESNLAELSGFTLENGGEYGGAFGGCLSNCIIRGCWATATDWYRQPYGGGGAFAAILTDCVLYGNEALVGGGASACQLTRCTVYGNWSRDAAGGVTFDCSCEDSIVWGNSAGENMALSNWESYGMSRWLTISTVFSHSCTLPDGFDDRGGNVTSDPLFAAAARGDMRLMADSPCLGTASDGRNMGWYQGEIPTNSVWTVGGEDGFTTVQDALDVALRGDEVLVAPGVYPGVVNLVEDVLIESTEGASQTVLDGAGFDRCFDDYGFASLNGFTLRNGVSETDVGGGACYGLLMDCVISNCTALAGGGAALSELVNCLIVRNRANAAGDGAGWGGGVFNCQLFNCTVADNSAANFGGGAYLDSGCAAVNTIVATNVCDQGFANGNDIYGMGYYETVCSISDQDAKFVDAANGDWRLSARSPCIDAGSNAFVYAERDLDGTNRIVGARVDMGCYEYCRTFPGWSTPDVSPDATAAEEAAAVAAAMTATGFSPTKANVLSDVAQYMAFSDWVAGRGLTVAAVNDSPTAFVSAALDAPELMELSDEDVQVKDFVPTGDGTSWKVKLALDAYDPARVSPALLKAAVGIVGAETPSGDYSAAGLNFVVTPAADGIDVNVTPPAGKNTYFMRSVVR